MPINWQDVVSDVATKLVSSSVVIGAAAWVINTMFSRRLEAFKIQAKADADATNEQFRSTLQMAALEHQVRFSKLHEKRAEVIAELYKRLVQVLNDARTFVLTWQPESTLEEHNAALQKIWALDEFIDVHRIYLPAQACVSLDRFVNVLKHPVIRIGVYGGIKNPTQRVADERIKNISDAFKAFEGDIPDALAALQSEFRAMLGDDSAVARTCGSVSEAELRATKPVC